MLDAVAATKVADPKVAPPFAIETLDGYLQEADIDLLVATSKHNIRYLTGGHHNHFYDYMDAIGVSRYLPVFVHAVGRVDDTAYIANRNEKDPLQIRERQGRPLWIPHVQPVTSGSIEAMTQAVKHIRARDIKPKRIGVEAAFIPWDAARILRDAFPDAVLVDALRPLERLRA